MKSPDLATAEVFTIEEAAGILRISRNAAYTLARQWRATGGRAGLPCIALGRCLRVPRVALLQMLTETSCSSIQQSQDLD